MILFLNDRKDFNDICKAIVEEMNKFLAYKKEEIKYSPYLSLYDLLSPNFNLPSDSLKEYTKISKKKIKLLLENNSCKVLYNYIKRSFKNIHGKILELFFQGIEKKYSPEKCYFLL
nr:hypothetical protein [uncultured Fusobacterium sp.]